MYLQKLDRTRIGKITIRLKANNYQLRWTYPKGERHKISISQPNSEGWDEAVRVSKMINRDIYLDDLDFTAKARFSSFGYR